MLASLHLGFNSARNVMGRTREQIITYLAPFMQTSVLFSPFILNILSLLVHIYPELKQSCRGRIGQVLTKSCGSVIHSIGKFLIIFSICGHITPVSSHIGDSLFMALCQPTPARGIAELRRHKEMY